MWFNILKEEETPHYHWPKPKELFEQKPDRALGNVMGYWYAKHKEEIDTWVDSQSNLESVYVGEFGKTNEMRLIPKGALYIFDRVKIQEYISDNKELLQKLGIPMDVDALVKYISEVPRHDEEGYDFIAQLFGGAKRADTPLRIHRREVKFRGKQRGFE